MSGCKGSCTADHWGQKESFAGTHPVCQGRVTGDEGRAGVRGAVCECKAVNTAVVQDCRSRMAGSSLKLNWGWLMSTDRETIQATD